MAQAIRAVYEQGWLRLLDPVNLIEDKSSCHAHFRAERARDVLDEILVHMNPNLLRDRRDKAAGGNRCCHAGQTAISTAIIEERREGP